MSKLWLKYKNWSKQKNRALHVTVHLLPIPVHMFKFCPECGLFCTFSIFSTQFNSILILHLKTTPNSSYNLNFTQFIFHLHILLQTSFMNSSKIILIWVMTHTQTKNQDLLGFVLNPNSISIHLNMNPTTKGSFHTFLVPCGFYQP